MWTFGRATIRTLPLRRIRSIRLIDLQTTALLSRRYLIRRRSKKPGSIGKIYKVEVEWKETEFVHRQPPMSLITLQESVSKRCSQPAPFRLTGNVMPYPNDIDYVRSNTCFTEIQHSQWSSIVVH